MNKIISVVLGIVFFTVPMFTQINNPDKPLKGKWDFRMKKIWEVQEAGDDIIGEIQNIRAAKDRRIYIADSKNFKIFIFSEEGKYISSFGNKGEGPGEIKRYHAGDQLFVVNDSVIFCEWGRISYFSLDGTFEKMIRVPSQLKPRTFISEDVFISAPAVILEQGNKTEKVILYNAKDQSEKVISEFKAFEKAMSHRQDGGRQMSVRMVIHNITPMMFVKYKNGKIYYGKSDQYQINIVNPEGKELGSFSIEQRKPKEISQAYKKRLGQGLGDIPQDMVKEILDGLPEKASFFQDIAIDKNGLVYIFVSDPNSESLQAIDIFSPEGKYLYSAEIKVEDTLSITGTYLKDELLMLALEDEDGNQIAAKYLIQLPTKSS